MRDEAAGKVQPDGGIIASTSLISKFQGAMLTLEIERAEIEGCAKNQAIASEEVAICVNGMGTRWRVDIFPKGTDRNENHENFFAVKMSLVSCSCYEGCFLGDLSMSIKTQLGLRPYNEKILDIRSVCTGEKAQCACAGYSWQSFNINDDDLYVDGKMKLTVLFCFKTSGQGLERFTEAQKEGEKKFSDDMRSIAAMDHLRDVTLVCGDERIPCHSAVLAARSPVLAAMFETDMKEKQKKEVCVPDANPAIVRVMLDYIYSGIVPANIGDIAPELIYVAEKYGLKLLTKACEEALVKDMTAENAVKTLILVDRFVPQSEIRNDVLNYIWGNAGDIMNTADWEEFVKSYPRLVTDLILFMAKEVHVQPKAKKPRLTMCS